VRRRVRPAPVRVVERVAVVPRLLRRTVVVRAAARVRAAPPRRLPPLLVRARPPAVLPLPLLMVRPPLRIPAWLRGASSDPPMRDAIRIDTKTTRTWRRSVRRHTTSATCETLLARPDAALALKYPRGGYDPSSCRQHVRTTSPNAQPSPDPHRRDSTSHLNLPKPIGYSLRISGGCGILRNIRLRPDLGGRQRVDRQSKA
jgi:hypothetical protein